MVKTFRALENSRYKALQQFAIPPTPKLSPAGKDRWDNPFSFDGFSSSEDEGGATPKGAGREGWVIRESDISGRSSSICEMMFSVYRPMPLVCSRI